jgi:organic radical activating enzyme
LTLQTGTEARAYEVIDGRIQARKLEIGVAEHCNLSCRSCSHLSPTLKKHLVDADQIVGQLELLAPHYEPGYVRLLGGEPLLHPDLVGIIEAVRRSGISDVVWVVTNGVRLPRMSEEFWHAVDRVECNMYPGGELSSDEQRQCKERADAAGTKLRFKAYEEFRESYSELGTDDPTLVEDIFETCEIVHNFRCHTLAQGRFYRCPQSYYVGHLIPAVAGAAERDSVLVENSSDLGAKLLALLESREPPTACGYCLGSIGKRFPHAQIRRSEFRDPQLKAAEELIDPMLRVESPRYPPHADSGATSSVIAAAR